MKNTFTTQSSFGANVLRLAVVAAIRASENNPKLKFDFSWPP
jgi:hypothetical protein